MSINTQCSAWAEPWEYLRDHARPVVPQDVGQLEVAREMVPPSKAHIKRLTRRRVEVVVVRRAPPKPADPDKLFINRLIQMGDATAKACGMYVERIYR